MALTVSSIEADFVKDTKLIGKQSAYLDFDFGGRVHSTDVLKSTGKFATWDTPVQLTGAGITMKVIAKASKTLGHDKPLGVGEINVLHAAGNGPQTVQLHTEVTGEYAGQVRMTISGGSPAISGLPHTEGHGLAGAAASALPGHHGTEQHGRHGGSALGGAAAGAGAAGLGAAALHHNQDQGGLTSQQGGIGTQQGGLAGQQGGLAGQQPGLTSQQGGLSGQPGVAGQQGNHNGALGGAAAGAGAAGLGAAALHHHNQGQQQGGLSGQQGAYGTAPPPSGAQHESLGQRVKEALPGHHATHHQGIAGQQAPSSYSGGPSGQTGALHPGGGSSAPGTGVGVGQTGGGGQAGPTACPQCHGTGSLAQRVEQGLHLGGQQPGTAHQGVY